MTPKGNKGKGQGHADAGSGHDMQEEHGVDFVPANSLYDLALCGLALLTALGIIAFMGIWVFVPVLGLEESADTPKLESGIAKP